MATPETIAASPAPQSRFLALWQNPVGKKAVMAVTGLALFLFSLGHVIGNLQVFKGPGDGGIRALDHYGELLRTSMPLLWTIRGGLLVMALLHVVAGVQLWLGKRAAREIDYQDYRPQVSTPASRTMIWSGLLILGFVVYHLLDLTIGVGGAPFEHGRVHDNLVNSLSRAGAAGFYVAAVIGLGFHLWHGLWSTTQSLGLAHRGVVGGIQKTAIFFAVAVTTLFAIIPLAVVFGLVS